YETKGELDVVAYKGDLIDSYEKVPIEEYYKFGSLNPFTRMEHVEHAPYAAIQLARGCRAKCTFCAVRDFMGKGVRHRPVEDVIAEIEFLINKRGVRHFEWLDDDPTFYHREFKQILQAIIDHKWDINWATNNGVIAATVDEELLRLMRDSHCIGFNVGIETGNPEMLRKIKKPAKHDKFLRLSRMHKKYPELFIGGNIILGLPDEKFYQMMDSFKFTLEVNLDWAAMTVCQMIRGASASLDSGEYFENQMKTAGRNVINFVPSRNSNKGEITSKAGLLRGVGVFQIDPESIPDSEQVKEIWFTFNLVCNYIFSKNLMPGERPDKFISWVLNAHKAYPSNPYMCLFLSLAYVLLGDSRKAEDFRMKAINYSQTAYWRERFEDFGLDIVINR
ncbi:MAG: radical SAM protein, partial [Planctomycetota bacterium]|nr:radical SAM protein [Planctomycetota bacterium]